MECDNVQNTRVISTNCRIWLLMANEHSQPNKI